MVDITRKQFMKGMSASVAALVAAPYMRPAKAETGQLDTVVIASADTPQTFDVQLASAYESWDGGHNLNESLFEYPYTEPENGISAWDLTNVDKVRPLLAEDFTVSNDGKDITIKLRKGVTSASGNTLSTKDIDFLFKVLTAKSSGARSLPPMIGNFDPQKDVEVKDDLTFTFKCSQPSPLLLPVLSLWLANIPDSAAIEPHITADDPTGSAFMSRNGHGFGPYALKSLKQGQEAVYEARDDYWWGDKPTARTIISRAVPESANRFALLQQGAVQIAAGLRPRELNLVERKASFNGNQLLWLTFNCKMAPFDNVDVRRALSFATPYDAILSSIYQGTAERAYGPLPDIYPNNIGREINRYDFDLASAKNLLSKAGHTALDVELNYSASTPNSEQIVLLIQAAWRQIGVNANLVKVDPSTYATRKFKGDMQVWLELDQANAPDMGYLAALAFSSTAFANFGKYSNAEFDERTFKMNSTMNQDERNEHGRRMQEILMDEAPWIPIAQPGIHWGLGGSVTSVGWMTDNGIVYKKIS